MNYHDAPPPQNFDELADWLLTIDSQFSPSELHGAIVGALCGAMRLPGARWAQFGFAIMGSPEAINRQFSELAEAVLGGLAREQFELLSGEDMTFQPYLPDDDETIEQRTDGLSDWCRGFLGGFAEAQVYQQKNAPQNDSADAALAPSLPDVVREALSDLAAIAQATVEDDDYDGDDAELSDDPLELDSLLDEDGESFEFEAADAEAAERDYMEIIEYVRLASMTVFSEYGWVEIVEQRQQQQQLPAADQPAPPGATKFFKSGNKTMH